MNGGYDDGYATCPCFWGTQPGSLVRTFVQQHGNLPGWLALDAGCGEGKNAAFLARAGATVDALEVSELAIQNALNAWPDLPNINWRTVDVAAASLRPGYYDLVVAYGLFHCLSSADSIVATVQRLRDATKPRGYHIVCAFNDRSQDLTAHPGFTPCLLPHATYVDLYEGWEVLECTDRDLRERHPNNRIEHSHSMTRLVARRP